MTVIDGHLRVRPRPKGQLPVQVDALFESIAKFYRGKAVGIVLSGALSDVPRASAPSGRRAA
jgi:chemotaxis response regulator CheB